MRRVILVIALSLLPATAGAVGLAPLKARGLTDGPAKAFYLTLANPYGGAETFETRVLARDEEEAAARVTVFPASVRLAGGRNRRLLVIVRDLAPGETYTFRVCAARAPKPQETLYARVCSTLSARRLAVRA